MAKEGEIYLGLYGVESDEELISTHAKEVKREIEEIGRSERTIGGTLKTDVTARKYTFTIPYEYIDSDTLAIIYANYELNQPMSLRIYITDETYFTNFAGSCPVVKIEPFSSTDFRTGFTDKLYKGDSIKFVEI